MGEGGVNQVERWYGAKNRNNQADHKRVPWNPAIIGRPLVSGEHGWPSISMGSASAE